MPIVTIETNVDRRIVNQTFQEKFSNLLATLVNVPIEYVTVTVQANQKLIFGGTDAPAALFEIKSVSGFNKEDNKRYSKAISELVKSQLDILPSRLYIYFNTVKLEDVGVEGGTLAG